MKISFVYQFGLILLVASIGLVTCQNELFSLLSNVIPELRHRLLETSGTIPVKIHLNKIQRHYGLNYVITNDELTAEAEIHDSSYVNKSLKFHWSTAKGKIPVDEKASKIVYKFPEATNATFLRLDVIYEGANKTNASGSYQIDLVVNDPVVVEDPLGKLFIEHGELLDIKLKFRGSPPFWWCHGFSYDFNSRSVDFCSFPFHYHEGYETEIPIVKYLHNVGNYTLMFDVYNIVSKLQQPRKYTIKISDTVREPTYPFAPIVGSISAVLILITGIALHLHFRQTAFTETADFDFIGQGQEEDDWEEEQSFIQRVRYILCRGEADEFDERRHLFNRGR